MGGFYESLTSPLKVLYNRGGYLQRYAYRAVFSRRAPSERFCRL